MASDERKEGPVPPGRARRRGPVHGRRPLDQRSADGLPGFGVQVAVAPVVDEPQPVELMTRRQVHDPPQTPRLVVAGGQGPLPGCLQIGLLAGHDVGHRQKRQGVAHFALPELLVATVTIVLDVRRRTAPDGTVGLSADLLPECLMAGRKGLSKLGDSAVVQIDPGMDPRTASSEGGIGSSRYRSSTLSRAIGWSRTSRSRTSISVGALVPYSSASQQDRAASGTRNSSVTSCHCPGPELRYASVDSDRIGPRMPVPGIEPVGSRRDRAERGEKNHPRTERHDSLNWPEPRRWPRLRG